MSCHKFPNLREQLSGDLTGKIMKNVVSLDFMNMECNCNKASLVDMKCIFGRDCRKSIVVYKCECICEKFHIGSTQNSVKKRMKGDYLETRNLINKEKTSDNCAKFSANHFSKIKEG